jgi:hypothetical protein
MHTKCRVTRNPLARPAIRAWNGQSGLQQQSAPRKRFV